jgi:hypothetical protein
MSVNGTEQLYLSAAATINGELFQPNEIFAEEAAYNQLGSFAMDVADKADVAQHTVHSTERFSGIKHSLRYAGAIGACTLALFGAKEMISGTSTVYGQDQTCTTTETGNTRIEHCVYPDGSETNSSTTIIGVESPTQPTPSTEIHKNGSTSELAGEVVELMQEGRIKVQRLRGGLHAKDLKTFSTPMQNLKSAISGERSQTSDRCSNAPDEGHTINAKILKFMRDLGHKTSYSVTAIVGGCHKNGSMHYLGKAVDIGCAFGARQVRTADRIGRNLGIRRNNENCARDAHYHYSVGGH